MFLSLYLGFTWEYSDYCSFLLNLGNDSHPFSASHHKYTMYFKLWHQQNDKHGTLRCVRRRPEFVSKEGMVEIAKRYIQCNIYTGNVSFQTLTVTVAGFCVRSQNLERVCIVLLGDVKYRNAPTSP